MPQTSKKDSSSENQTLDKVSKTKARADKLFMVLIVIFLIALAWMLTQVKSCTD